MGEPLNSIGLRPFPMPLPYSLRICFHGLLKVVFACRRILSCAPLVSAFYFTCYGPNQGSTVGTSLNTRIHLMESGL